MLALTEVQEREEAKADIRGSDNEWFGGRYES